MRKLRSSRHTAAIVAVLALTCAAPAHAYLYWGSHHRSIGRTANNGTRRDLYFIKIRRSSFDGIVVNGRYIYWNNSQTAIGRANLDGSGIRRSFIRAFGDELATDGAHLYWESGYAIGRANVDGTDVEPNFINFQPAGRPHPPTGLIGGLAVDSTHVYWSQWDDNVIGRANIDGSAVDRTFLRTPCPGVLAVDANHIYWSHGEGNPQYNRGCRAGGISRANISGSGVRTLVKGVVSTGIALDRRYIYVTDDPGLGIDRWTLNGTHFKALSLTAGGADALAVDGLGPGGFPASSAFASFCGCSGV